MAGDKLKTLRKILGWSQGDLSRRLDISRMHVYNLETGRNHIRKKHVVALEKALNEEIFSQIRMFDQNYDDVKALLAVLQEEVSSNRKTYHKRVKDQIYL